MRSKGFQQFLWAMLTFFLVNVTWVFFRAQDFTTAWRLLGSMFGISDGGAPVLSYLSIVKVSVVVVGMIATQWALRNTSVLEVAEKTKWWIVGIVWAIMLFALVLSQESSGSFIYFQF